MNDKHKSTADKQRKMNKVSERGHEKTNSVENINSIDKKDHGSISTCADNEKIKKENNERLGKEEINKEHKEGDKIVYRTTYHTNNGRSTYDDNDKLNKEILKECQERITNNTMSKECHERDDKIGYDAPCAKRNKHGTNKKHRDIDFENAKITNTDIPDGGWGWMVAIGTFIVMMLVPMLFPCFGILFSGYLLSKGASSTTTAWIFNIQGFIWNIMGIFTQPLVDQFGWRNIGFISITLVSASLVVSAFAPSPVFLFFSLSLLSGVGGGLVTSICFLIIPTYFEKHRGVANGIMMTGICSGEILGPLLVRILLEEYSFLGANLVIGAILLNGYIGVLFFHPVEWHKSFPKYIDKNKHTLPQGTKQYAIGETTLPKSPSSLIDGNHEKNCIQILWKRSSIYLGCHYNWTLAISDLKLNNSSSGDETLQETILKEKKTKKFVECLYSVILKSLRDLAVLKSPKAAIIATGNMLCMNSVLNFVMMVPFALQALDHSLQDSAWCLSVSAICNLLTRMIISPLSDWKGFSMKLSYMGGYLMLALSMLIFPCLDDLKWLEAVMGLFGCALGANMALYNLIMIEYMGVENLGAVFGASGIMVGFGFLFFGTVSGLVRDMSGSYTASIWMLSGMSLTSFLLWMLMPSAVAYDESEDEHKKKDIVKSIDSTKMMVKQPPETSCSEHV